MQNQKNNHIDFIQKQFSTSFFEKGLSVAIGIFNKKGKLLYANESMCYILDTDSKTLAPKNTFVNPVFDTFTQETENKKTYEVLITIGNSYDVSYSLKSKIYNNNDEIIVLAEADIAYLFEENKKMSVLNQQINNLQRELIKEKKNLQYTLKELRETEQMLIHSEKMNALGKLVAGIAHEINNPISFVYSNLHSLDQYIDDVFTANEEIQVLISQQSDIDLQKAVEDVNQRYEMNELKEDITDMTKESKSGIDRVKTIVEDLRKFSRLDEAEIKEINLLENIISTINIIRPQLKMKDITFKLECPEELMIECFPGQLNQAIINIMNNAIDAVEKGGEISLTITDDTEFVNFKIADNGCGIDEEVCKRIFDPFFTTKPVGSGVGLGLSITYKIIHDLHGGNITVNSLKDKGTDFLIVIPKFVRPN